MDRRHVKLTLLESTRSPLAWLRTPWLVVGFGAIGAAVSSALIATTVPTVLPEPVVDAIARFIAPPKTEARAQSAERLSYLGLGQPAAHVDGVIATPHDEGTIAVAAEAGGNRLEDLLPAANLKVQLALTEIEVDSAASLDPAASGPEYPARLLRENIEGVVLAQFVVDSLGRADTSTFVVLEPANPEFITAVKTALPKMKYRPAKLAGKPVAQLVQQPFGFRIRKAGVPLL